MFAGSLPGPAVEQLLRETPLERWGDVYVCCSGSFRVDRAVARKFGDAVRVHSNDVALLSVLFGRVALREFTPLRFTGRLEFIEEYLAENDANAAGDLGRLAAVLVALELGVYAGGNEYAKAHFSHYRSNFGAFHARALKKVAALLADTRIHSFFAGDLRDHARTAAQHGGGVIAFPPPAKGSYERLYRFLSENTSWEPPGYDVWDPKDLPEWLDELDAAGVPFCVAGDVVIPGRSQIGRYYSASNKTLYLYGGAANGSVRRAVNNSAPFRYEAIDPWRLEAGSRVQIIAANSLQMNFLKDVYLAKGIHHVAGDFNFIVYLDGMLAGGIILARSKFGDPGSLYMLSDFSLTRQRRVSKLIPMLATSRDVIRVVEKKLLFRITEVYTTAFTRRSVSMKYRGIYDLAKRGDGFINYRSDVRAKTAQELYAEWWWFHGRKATKDDKDIAED